MHRRVHAVLRELLTGPSVRDILGKTQIPRRAPPPAMRTACSHFTRLPCYIGGRGGVEGRKRSGVCGHAPRGRGEQNSHMHAGRENKTRATQPPSASSIRLQTGCGRTGGGIPQGDHFLVFCCFLRAPLSPPSCPRPLCTRRNRWSSVAP